MDLRYAVKINGKIVKTYKHKIQCCIWLVVKGYCQEKNSILFLPPHVNIIDNYLRV